MWPDIYLLEKKLDLPSSLGARPTHGKILKQLMFDVYYYYDMMIWWVIYLFPNLGVGIYLVGENLVESIVQGYIWWQARLGGPQIFSGELNFLFSYLSIYKNLLFAKYFFALLNYSVLLTRIYKIL